MRDGERLAQLGAESLGVWRRRDALRVLTRDELALDIGEGTVQCPLPGVCMDGGIMPSADQWLAISVLASSDTLPTKLQKVTRPPRWWPSAAAAPQPECSASR